MSFIVFLAAGFFSGLLGGMGMGGGTVLIPALTLFAGVEQHVAQATNLIAFLPAAALGLSVHKKQGLVSLKGLAPACLSALAASVAGGFAAAALTGGFLRKLYGIFLIALGLRGLAGIKFTSS